ncbi:MAG: hypothetical protein R3F62_10140 [Planctomycetota bacterium]
MPPLIPCPGCKRHVRSQEATCPFCEAALPRPRSVSPGLAAAAGLALLAGCERGDAPQPVYGAPDPAPVLSDQQPAPPDDRDDLHAEYGAPMPPDDLREPGEVYGAPMPPDDRDDLRAEYGAPMPPDDRDRSAPPPDELEPPSERPLALPGL